ncbi:MAG: ATP synthase F1 subunit gamma [Dehalococcoidales bacterium]
MANIRLIRNRIRGVKNIAKITKAMEMIAASKMRKAQEYGLAGRPYSEKITQVISNLMAFTSGQPLHPCLESREDVKKITIIHITPDRGLAGGLVGNINRVTGRFILEKNTKVGVIAVGKKGLDFLRRTGRQIDAEFTGLGDYPDLLSTLPISHIVLDEFPAGNTDEVYISYTKFINTMSQQAVMEKLLPVEPAKIPPTENIPYTYEPDEIAVLNGLIPRFVEMKVYHAILESIASEQSARMVAMRNATQNAKELVQDLTLVYNKARQEMITNELLDITGGTAALE